MRFAPIGRPSTTEGPVTSGLAIFQPSRWDEVFDFYMPTWTFSSMLYNELPYLRLFLNTYASLHTSTRGTKLEVGITGASDVRIKTTVVDLFEQNFSDLVLTIKTWKEVELTSISHRGREIAHVKGAKVNMQNVRGCGFPISCATFHPSFGPAVIIHLSSSTFSLPWMSAK